MKRERKAASKREQSNLFEMPSGSRLDEPKVDVSQVKRKTVLLKKQEALNLSVRYTLPTPLGRVFSYPPFLVFLTPKTGAFS